MAQRSKRYITSAALIQENGARSISEAVQLVKKAATAKFDETVECAIRLAANPSKGEENVRGVTVLPHGTGKVPRVAVFAKGEAAREAEEAGADRVGAEDLVEAIEKGWDDFDVLVAHVEMMRAVGRLGKKLGPRMPSKKAGNITTDVGKAVKALKSGQVEFKMDKGAVVHVPIGKASFEPEQLEENLRSLLDAIIKARPPTLKGRFIESVHLSTTMGPSVRVDIGDVLTKGH